ncbi:PREDICTED: tudor domain-containing protein 6 [Gekko japonicus]|uniref:Tudor domain-containing protein 6 n=1 Tax=Gekko japonicus TaxID=146911 RepID=A0ABM1JKA0_GEKJA|nr:PREDICTED: tudor domain-containing protein 6 [Gekko japonicus]
MKRGAKAAAAEAAAWLKMCSELPTAGTSVTLRVSFVEVHPESPLARLWGLSGEWRELYARLRDDIQADPGPRLASAPGGVGAAAAAVGFLSVGDLCLVELGGRWLRCRVVGRLPGPGRDYRVFLLDEGRTVSAGPYYLARGREEFFHLPSEVLGCILADLVPPGNFGAEAGGEPQGLRGGVGGGRLSFGWTAGAVEFLGYLHGKEVTGLVREVLFPQRLVVLELPWLLAQMHHLGLASQISPAAFRTLINASLGGSSLRPEQAPLPATSTPARGRMCPGSLDYYYPKLELNVTESVLVTEICDPHRIYCQLRSLSKEICRLSDAMSQAFEGARGDDPQEALPAPGSPCAARGIDGRWYRALLLELYPGGSPEEQPGAVAQVICVDYGRKEFVTKRNLRHLSAECFRMPVVTYLCSLQGVTDGGCGWTRSQISELKTLLLGKALQAHIEAYCAFEHVYYVTFFGEEGFNLNCLFGVQARCLTQRFVHSHQGHTSDLVAEKESISAPAKKEPLSTFTTPSLPTVHLKAGECHKAQVSFLQDPTQFSVYLQEYHQPLCHLKQNLQDFYSQSKKLEGVLLEPQPGSLCCVMLKENSYHRAIVTSVQGEGIEVYLVDRGSTELVDLYKVKDLLPQFRELPAVALRCALANPSPSQPWSPGSVDYFKKAVLNKELVMQVLGMQGDIYIVELFDHSLAGEKNLAKIMSQGKYAEHHDKAVLETIQKLSDKLVRKSAKEQGVSHNPKTVISAKDREFPSKLDRPALTTKHQAVESICSLPSKAVGKEESKGVPDNLPCLAKNSSERRAGLSCEGQLEVGSTVDVIVSYVESPSLFWCQLAKTSHDLKILMAEIQHYCLHAAQPHDWLNPVCLAKYSGDEKWYRALIIRAAHPTEGVEVAYVDYGNKEVVPLKNLCSTRAEFLQLKAQAFRCSLYNLIQPDNQDPFVWDEKATEAFQEFVDSATKIELKCTIFALAALDNTYLLNVVDLITPFESACHFLTRKGLAKSVAPQKPLASSVHLLSYYYSTHDIKIGSEELVYVTHVQDLCLFYCQLARSAHVLEHLTDSISKLSKVGHGLKSSPDLRNLYLAKYTDGCWYRAILAQGSSTKEVFFVDYGNTESLKKEDLMLVPGDAYEIQLLPMQAIKCSLSDIAKVPKEAIAWFEKLVLDNSLKALIVAKEPDGKLIVELYDGKIQINAKLKERLDLQGSKRMVRSAENRELGSEARRPFFTGAHHSTPEIKRQVSKNLEPLGHSKPSAACREVKPSQQKTKREMVTQSRLPVEGRNQADPVTGRTGHDEREGTADSLENRNQNEIFTDSPLKKMCDLPLKNLSPGFKTFVYVSHINSPSDFYVQLVEEEPLLDSISEKLNQSEMVENLNGQQLYIGDLICAVFPEDSLWYRAVVQKQPSDELVSVQYIDYGNTAVVNICKTCRLLEDCALCPGMSIRCSLGGVKTGRLPEWTEEAVLCFSQSTSEIQMNCEFVEKRQGKWEVILCDREGNVTADLVNSHLACKKSLSLEAPDKNETEPDLIHLGHVTSDEPSRPAGGQDAKSFFWKTPVGGQTVEAFARATESADYFWCQFADLNEIISIEKKVQDATKLAGFNVGDIKIGCPCLAKCSKDENFYRAIVTSVQENILRVTHVDYGTEDLVTREMLRQISDELLTLPPQAFLCSLFGFNSSEGSWVEGTIGIFCGKIVDSLLDVTVMEILCNRPFEIPLFVVNLECQGESINAHMKPFWKPNNENGGAAVANLLSDEGQNKDAKAEDLEVLHCEMGISACTSLASKDTMASEDLLCASEPFQPTEECSASTRNVELCEMKGNEDPAGHHQTTFEVLDIGEQPAIPEVPTNELDCLTPERESDSQMSALSCIDVSEVLLPARIEAEVSGQNTFEAQEEVKDWKATLIQDPFDMELLLSAGKDSSGSLAEPGSIDVNQLSCEEMGETSKLVLVEEPWVERELDPSPLLMDEVDCGLSCEQERPLELPAPSAPFLLAVEIQELPILPAAPASSPPEIPSCLSESKLKPQAEFCMGEEDTDLCEIGPDAPKQDDVKPQTVLEESLEPVETRPVTCSGFEESDSELADDGDSATRLQWEERAETSSQSAEKNETPCELEGVDVGPKCVVKTDAQGYEVQILDASAEGTQLYVNVLNLFNGNKETVSPINVWNGISEQNLGPAEVLCDEMGTPLESSESSLEADAVKEETADSDSYADPLGLSDQED